MKWKNVVSVALLSAFCMAAHAQGYPNRPVQMILGWSAGASVDTMARAVAVAMTTSLHQGFIILNREGASGSIAFATMVNAKPDGYTLTIGPTQSINFAGHLLKNKPFDVDSMEYVCQIFVNDFTISVPKQSPYLTLKDLIDAIRSRPGRLSYGHLGVASIPHLALTEFLQKVEGDALGIPYKGDARVLPALFSGEIDFAAPAVLSVAPHGDRVRVLAVFGDRRSPAYPELPTLAEQGIRMSPSRGMNGIFAPKNTPPEILATLRQACASTVDNELVKATARTMKSVVEYLDAPAFAKAVHDDYERQGALIRQLNIQPN